MSEIELTKELLDLIDELLDGSGLAIIDCENQAVVDDARERVNNKTSESRFENGELQYPYGRLAEKNAEIERLQQQLKQQWVNVDDDLPKHDTPVLVWNGCDYDIDYTDMECDYGTTFFANTQGVTTHWMALPKPPTK